MLDIHMTVERLLAHSIIFDEAARLQRNERVAGELNRLADQCVQTALAMAGEMKFDA